MAFGRRPEKNKVRPGGANPSPRLPILIQANNQPQPPNTRTFRPPPIPTQRHLGSNHTYTAPPATTYSPNSGWAQSTALKYETQITTEGPETWQENAVQGPPLCDLIASKFDAVLTSIDGETFDGDERELGAQISHIFHDSVWLTCCQSYMKTLNRCSEVDGALREEKFPEVRIGLSLPLSSAPTTSQRRIFMPILDYRPIFPH